MALGPLMLLVLAVLAILFSGVPLYCAVDAARMGDDAWAQAGRSKSTWVALLVACAIFWGVGLVGAGYYYLQVRSSVANHQRDPNRPTIS